MASFRCLGLTERMLRHPLFNCVCGQGVILFDLSIIVVVGALRANVIPWMMMHTTSSSITKYLYGKTARLVCSLQNQYCSVMHGLTSRLLVRPTSRVTRHTVSPLTQSASIDRHMENNNSVVSCVLQDLIGLLRQRSVLTANHDLSLIPPSSL